jgi:hypothetical protein
MVKNLGAVCTQCERASIFIITMFLFSFASNGMLR